MKKIYIMLLCVLLMLPMAMVGHAAKDGSILLGKVEVYDAKTDTLVKGGTTTNYLFKEYETDIVYYAKSKKFVRVIIDGLEQNTSIYEGNTKENPLVLRTNQDLNITYTENSSGYPQTLYYVIREPQCDGSACPATDQNEDAICDDCGMRLMLRSPGATLPDPYTVWDAEKQQTYQYAFVYTDADGNNFLIMSESRPHLVLGEVVIDEGTFRKYTIWGSEWRYDDSGTEGLTLQTTNVIPSFHLFNADGSVAYWRDGDFFPLTLWQEMGELTQGEMGTMLQKTMKTMGILVLCGIGCLALLMVLILFGKVFSIYRV